MIPLYSLAAAGYLLSFAALLFGMARRSMPALVTSALIVAGLTGFLFVGYTSMLAGAEKVVEVRYSPVVPIGDPGSSSFEDWARQTPDGLVEVVVETRLGGEATLVLDPREGLVTGGASPGWADFQGGPLPNLMPRYAQVDCRWSDPVVDFLQAGCRDERSWALILPSAPQG